MHLKRTASRGLIALVSLALAVVGASNAAQEVRRAEVAQQLRRGGLASPRPPVVLIPGIASSRLIAWQRKICRGPNINIPVHMCGLCGLYVCYMCYMFINV